jgi:hypothetical protein
MPDKLVASVGRGRVRVRRSRLRRQDPPQPRPLLYLGAAYTAASRVYVGAHYPTDVAAAAGLGAAIAVTLDASGDRLRARAESVAHGAPEFDRLR